RVFVHSNHASRSDLRAFFHCGVLFIFARVARDAFRASRLLGRGGADRALGPDALPDRRRVPGRNSFLFSAGDWTLKRMAEIAADFVGDRFFDSSAAVAHCCVIQRARIFRRICLVLLHQRANFPRARLALSRRLRSCAAVAVDRGAHCVVLSVDCIFALRDSRKNLDERGQALVLLSVWALFILLFFSWTKSRMEYYSFSAWPAIAI